MRKIVDDVKNMTMCELMNNCMFIKNGDVWYRDFSEEIPFRDLMRKLIKYHVPNENIYEDIDNIDAEHFDSMIIEDYGGTLDDWESIEFVLAMFYTIGCGMAEVREWLKEYENMVHCENCKYFKYKHIKNIHDETKTLFEGYICQLSNQIVCGEDYCSRGEEKK